MNKTTEPAHDPEWEREVEKWENGHYCVAYPPGYWREKFRYSDARSVAIGITHPAPTPPQRVELPDDRRLWTLQHAQEAQRRRIEGFGTGEATHRSPDDLDALASMYGPPR